MNNHEDNVKAFFIIQELIDVETDRINIGAFWFSVGIGIIIIGMVVSPELVAMGIFIVLFGLEKLINGNSLKSRYLKMLPEYVLPPEIACIKCGQSLELDLEERLMGKYFCPECNKTLHYSR